MNDLIPMLETDDLNQTIQWYSEILGYAVQGTYPAEGQITWASLKKDKVVIMFTSRFDSKVKSACNLTGSTILLS